MRRVTPFVVALLTLPVVALATTVIHVYRGNSIQAVIDTAEAGVEVICVHPGTYSENIELLQEIHVYSSDGSDSTIIAGDPAWTRTVFADGLYDSTYFAGFTIEGGDGYGMYAWGCLRLHCEDLVFNCDADTAALYDFHASSFSRFENITINGPSDAMSGLEAHATPTEYDSITVRGIEKRGIYVWDRYGPSFSAITVDSCGTGVYINETAEATFDGGTISNCTTGFEAYTPDGEYTAKLDVRHVDVSDCATGFSTGADSGRVVNVAIDTCTVTDCTDGMILDRPSGHVKCTDFEDIDDIAITVTEGERLVIGALADSNTFNDVDVVGVLADSGAVVTIQNNFFDYVLGTAVQVETANDNTVVSYCDMDGSGGCYEGIATSVDGTMAMIRECDLYDYSVDQIPKPRGVTVFRTTANLGKGSSDKGNNSFVTKAINLSYRSKASTPPTLYAEHNWWGEDPPDTNQFTGRVAYIDYDPWLDEAPARLLPVTEGPAEVPTAPGLTNVCPNPGAGSVELQFWMPEDGRVELSVYNLEGRLVRTLFNGEVTAGPGSVRWDGCDGVKRSCPSGVYLIHMISNGGTDTGRFVLVR